MNQVLRSHAERTMSSCVICDFVSECHAAELELLWLEAEMHPANWTVEQIERLGWIPLCQEDANALVKGGARPYRLRSVADKLVFHEYYPGGVRPS